MTVRELIAELSKLDQDRGIWIFYDYPCGTITPDPPYETASKEAARIFELDGVKEGDYVINAW